MKFDERGKLLESESWWDEFKVGKKEDLNKSLADYSKRA